MRKDNTIVDLFMNYESLLQNLCTQGFHIIEGLLDPLECQSLRSQAQKMYDQGLFRGAKIGLQLESHKNESIRKDEIFWLEGNETQPAIKAFLNQIHQLAQIINQSLFLSVQEFETHFALYQPGAYYKKHRDQFANKKNRKISFVYYLNKDWHSDFGGELKLYNKEDELIQAVLPEENRFICFNSELVHEVCLTHQPRYSITGWMKTRPNTQAISKSILK